MLTKVSLTKRLIKTENHYDIGYKSLKYDRFLKNNRVCLERLYPLCCKPEKS